MTRRVSLHPVDRAQAADRLVHDYAKTRGLTKELARLGYSEPMPIAIPTQLDRLVADGLRTPAAGHKWRS